MRYKTLIYELGLVLHSLFTSVIVSKVHSEYNLNNKAVCRCFENNSSKKLVTLKKSTATDIFWGFFIKWMDFPSDDVSKRGIPKALHTYWNDIQFFFFMFKTAILLLLQIYFRNSQSEVFLRKAVLKICSKFTGEHPSRSATSIKLLCNLLHIFRTPFPKNTCGWLLLIFASIMSKTAFLSI